MKKRILAIALTVAMLLSMLPAQVFATEPAIQGDIHTEHNYRPVTTPELQEPVQTPEVQIPSQPQEEQPVLPREELSEQKPATRAQNPDHSHTKLISATLLGELYLSADYTYSPPGNVPCYSFAGLCLNSYTLTLKRSIEMRDNGVLNILDCSEGSTGLIDMPVGSALVCKSGNTAYTINLYSGTVRASLTAVELHGSFNMYGGTIDGGWDGIDNYGDITIENGTICATGRYGIEHRGNSLVLSGTPSLSSDNGDVYLYSGKTMTIAGKLTPGGDQTISVLTEIKPEINAPVQITTGWNSTLCPVETFISVEDSYEVRAIEKDGVTELYLVVPPHEHFMAVDTTNGLPKEDGTNGAQFVSFMTEIGSLEELMDLDSLVESDNANVHLATGQYYLTADIELDPSQYIGIVGNVDLCLNGHKITFHNAGMILSPGGQLRICDCNGGVASEKTEEKTGAITSDWEEGAIRIRDTGTPLELYGVNVAGKTIAISCIADSSVKVYDSYISAVNPESTFLVSAIAMTKGTLTVEGGTLYAEGGTGGTYTINDVGVSSLNLSGVTIKAVSCATRDQDRGLYSKSAASIIVKGCIVDVTSTGSGAYGIDVAGSGTLTVSENTQISANGSSSALALIIQGSVSAQISDSTLTAEGKSSSAMGLNTGSTAAVTVEHCIITAKNQNGATFGVCGGSAPITLTDCEVSSTLTGNGTVMGILGNGSELTVSDSEICATGNMSSEAYGIHIGNQAKLTDSSVQATAAAGKIYGISQNGTLEIDGKVTIDGNAQPAEGTTYTGIPADIYLPSGKVVTIGENHEVTDTYSVFTDVVPQLNKPVRITLNWNEVHSSLTRFPFVDAREKYDVRKLAEDEADAGYSNELYLTLYDVEVEIQGPGTVAFGNNDQRSYAAGDTVQFTATAGEGSAVVQVTASYVDENGTEQTIELTPSTDDPNTYTFTMPAGNVTVLVAFQEPHKHYMAVDTEKGLPNSEAADGNDAEFVEFGIPVDETNIANYVVDGVLQPGNYVLEGNITLDQAIIISGMTNLCLKGSTLDFGTTGGLQVAAGATLNVCNCVGTGKITAANGTQTVEVAQGGAMNLYGGSIEATAATANAVSNAGTTCIFKASLTAGSDGILNNGTLRIESEEDITITAGNYGINAQTEHFYLSGSPVINGKKGDIYLAEDKVVNITGKVSSKDGETWSVAIGTPLTAEDPIVPFTADWTAKGENSSMDVFVAGNRAFIKKLYENELVLEGHVHTLKDGSKILYDVALTNELVKAGKLPKGNYLVVETIETDGSITFAGVGENHLCLFGNTLTSNYKSGHVPGVCLENGVELRIDDCQPECGTIHANWFGFSYVVFGGTHRGKLTLVNGNLTTLPSGSSGLLGDGYGLVIGGEFVMEGGSLTGFKNGIITYPNTIINIMSGTIDATNYGIDFDESSARLLMSGNPVIYGGTADINLYRNMVIEIPQALIPPVTDDGYTEAYSVVTYANPTATAPVRFTRGWGENADLDYIPFYSPKGYLVREMDYTYTNEAGEEVTTKELYLVVPEITVPFYVMQGQSTQVSVDALMEKVVGAYNNMGKSFRDYREYIADSASMAPVEEAEWPTEEPPADLTQDQLEDWYEDRIKENEKILFTEIKDEENTIGYSYVANADGSYTRKLSVAFRDEKFIAKKDVYVIPYTITVNLDIKVFDVKDSLFVLDYGITADLDKNMYLKDVLPGTILGKEPVAEGTDPSTELWIETYATKEPVLKIADNGFDRSLQVDGYVPIVGTDPKLEIEGFEGDFVVYKDGNNVIYTPTDTMEQGEKIHLVFRAMDKNLMEQLQAQEGMTLPELGEALSPTVGMDFFKTVTVIPANVVYYEDTIFHYTDTTANEITVVDGNNATATQDGDANGPYGNDSTYAEYTEGNLGSLGSYTTIHIKEYGEVLSFDFTGTGFELVGSTTMDSGMMILTLSKEGSVVSSGLLDTIYNSGSIHELPLVRKTGLEYGTYHVSIEVVPLRDYGQPDGWVWDEELEMMVPPILDSYLYLDGVRVYNPLAADSEHLKDYAEGEATAEFIQIRDLLLKGQAASAKLAKTEEGGTKLQFASGTISYVENANESAVYEGNAVSSINDYLLAGPNNEVYFSGEAQSLILYIRENGETPMLQIAVRNLNTTAFTGAQSVAPGLVLLGSKGAVLQSILPEGKTIGYSEQYYTVNYSNCPKETLQNQEYYRVVISATNGSSFSMTNLKCNDLEFYTIPNQAASYSYVGGELVDSNAPDPDAMPNLQELTWQLQALTGSLPGVEQEPDTDQELVFSSVSLSLQSNIGMNFYVQDAVLEGYEKPYVVFEKEIYNADGSKSTQSWTVEEFDLLNDSHVFRFNELSAKEMGSTVKATIYATKDGSKVTGETKEYSVLTYATNLLAKFDNAKLRTLLVDMLNYGAAAQSWFNYNTANLVNSSLTEEQKGYGTATAPTMVSYKNSTGEDYVVNIKGVTLSLEDKVELNFYVDLSGYTGQSSDLSMKLTYTNVLGKSSEAEVKYEDFVLVESGSNAGLYSVTFDCLNATDMRSICSAKVCEKGESVSNLMTYSIECYAASVSEKTADQKLKLLLANMMKYGDATAAYFAGLAE